MWSPTSVNSAAKRSLNAVLWNRTPRRCTDPTSGSLTRSAATRCTCVRIAGRQLVTQRFTSSTLKKNTRTVRHWQSFTTNVSSNLKKICQFRNTRILWKKNLCTDENGVLLFSYRQLDLTKTSFDDIVCTSFKLKWQWWQWWVNSETIDLFFLQLVTGFSSYSCKKLVKL